MDIKYGRRRLVSREEKRELIKKNIPWHMFGHHATEFLANAAAGMIEEEELEITHLVVKALVKYEIESSGCHCSIVGAFREYHSRKNTFWVKCDINPSSTITEKNAERFVRNTKRFVERVMKKSYGLEVIFGSPPQWQQR